MTHGRRALIIGGSLSGLLAAHLLRNIGWQAIVFERHPVNLIGRGAGISTQIQFRDIMHRIGIPFDDSMGIVLERLICLNRAGEVELTEPTTRTMSAWSRLYGEMLSRLPGENYRLGMQFVGLEQDGDAVTALFSDGSRLAGDLLIGADGARSTVREQFLPKLQPNYAGYVAWRAMIDEGSITESGSRKIFDLYTFCLPEGELFLGYPVPGRNNETSIGKRAYNIVWYRPTGSPALADLCTDANGHCHGITIPPPLIRPELAAQIKAKAHALVAPQVADIFERCEQPFFQPIVDLESPQIAFGRVALVGDAAFVARPHVGAGVTKAALDAQSLADAIRTAGNRLDEALARYQHQQLAFGRGLVALGRQEGAYLSGQLKPREQRTGEELHREVGDVVYTHNARTAKIQELVASRKAVA